MSAIATFSPAELQEYLELPEAVRLEALHWHEVFLGVRRSGAKIRTKCGELATVLGASASTVKNKFYAWEQAGRSWRACVNWARVNGRGTRTSPEFHEWYVRHAARFQRNTRAAHRDFGARWKRGEAIPGLDPTLPRTRLPEGCSYGVLQRVVRKHAFAVEAVRRGLGVARSHGPMILSTRKGLWVGSHLAIDDVWHDNFVVWQGQLVRVLQLSVLDVFSGCLPTYGTKPRFKRADGSFDNLKERFARMCIAAHLRNFGYSPRGTEILSEHGTAAMSDHAKAVLTRWTDGKVWVRESGIVGQEQALLGLGRGQGKGNFRHKAHLESLHNLIHNQLAAIPGQTGKDEDHRPEQTHGQLAGDQDLLRAARWLARMAPDKVALLQTRLLHYHAQFLPLLAAHLEAINRRGEDPELWTHDLEGWPECGHCVVEYLDAAAGQYRGDDWLKRLPAPAQNALLTLAQTAPEMKLLRERRLSPHEVWQAGKGELIQLPDAAVAELIGDDFAREATVRDCQFEFQDQELAPEPLQYASRAVDAEGRELELPNGETYTLRLNPFDLDVAYVRDASGRDVGLVRRALRVQRGDAEALQAAFKHQATRQKDLLAPIRRADATELAAETRRVKANNELLASALKEQGVRTPAQARIAQREAELQAAKAAALANSVRQFAGETEDFVTELQPAVADEGGEAFSSEGLL